MLERRLKEELRARELNDVLFEIGRHLNPGIDSDEVTGLALGLACDAVGGTCAALHERELGGWITAHVFGSSLAHVGAFRVDSPSSALAEIVRTKRAVVRRANLTSEPPVRGANTREADVTMAFPILVRGDLVGAMVFCLPPDEADPGEAELEFGTRLAFMLSTTRENSQNLRRHRQIADAFQRDLPRMPRGLSGVELAHAYSQAPDAQFAGGDFYDAFALGDGRVALAIGDVAGRAPDAAVLATMVRDCIRITALDGLAPSDVIRRTNRVLMEFSKPEMSAVVHFAIIDVNRGEMIHSSGGNPPPVYVGHDGMIRALPAGGPRLGVSADIDVEDCIEALAPGDKVVFFTDGLTGARGAADRVLGIEGVREMLAGAEGCDVPRLVAHLREAAANFAGRPFEDDVAILVAGLPSDPPASTA